MVDALCSGRSVRKDVLVRIQSWALKEIKAHHIDGLFYFTKRKDVLVPCPTESVRRACPTICLV